MPRGMVAGKQKSRAKRRVDVRIPSGFSVRTYRTRKPGAAICGGCHKKLQGIPHLILTKFKALAKTQKRPQRPYGGVLCSVCARKEIINKVRSTTQ